MSSTRRKQANDTTKSCEESEDSVSQALEDLGLLEDGMTYQDKKDLLSVVRMSENTAQAEEEDRKAKDTQPQVMQQVVGDSPECVIEDDVSEEDETQEIFTSTGSSSMPEVSSTSLLVRRAGFLSPHTTSKAEMKSSPFARRTRAAMSEISTTSPHAGRADATTVAEISTTSPIAKRTFCLPTDLAALSEISTTSPPKRTTSFLTDTCARNEIDSTSLLVKGSDSYPGDEISTTSSPVNRFHSLANAVSEIGSTSPLAKRMRTDVGTTSFLERTGAGINIPERDKISPPSSEELVETKQIPVSQSRATFQVKHPVTPPLWLTVSAQADSSKRNVELECKGIENVNADDVDSCVIQESNTNRMTEGWTSKSENVKPTELSNTNSPKDDKDGNIDVFSHSSNCYQQTLLRRKLRRVQERIPFYFVPKGMDVYRYTSYFKQYVDGYYKRLAALQRRNIEHMKWGDPIEIGSNGRGLLSSSMRSEGEEEANNSRRYNFRDRFPKTRLRDFPSENSDDGGEEDSNDEDIFTVKNRRLPGIKLGAKRKILASNDPTSPKKEKKDSGLINRKVQNSSIASTEVEKSIRSEVYSEQSSQANGSDSGDDFLANRKVPENKHESLPRKRVRKRPQKTLQTEVLDQNSVADGVNIAEESRSDLVSVPSKKVPRNKRRIPAFQMTRRQIQIFSALTQQNQASNSVGDIDSVDTSEKTLPDCSIENSNKEQQENVVIKPRPLNIRPRRKLHLNPDSNDQPVKKKSEPGLPSTRTLAAILGNAHQLQASVNSLTTSLAAIMGNTHQLQASDNTLTTNSSRHHPPEAGATDILHFASLPPAPNTFPGAFPQSFIADHRVQYWAFQLYCSEEEVVGNYKNINCAMSFNMCVCIYLGAYCLSKVGDDLILCHGNNRASEVEEEGQDDKIPCPICGNMFPASEIEEHASDCNLYGENSKAGSGQDRDVEDP